MSAYQNVTEQLESGIAPDVLCATCPWDRLCVSPPSMSRQDVDSRIKAEAEKDKARRPGEMPINTLLTALVVAGNATTGEQCPVFSLRLRGPDGRQIADAIRTHMRGLDT